MQNDDKADDTVLDQSDVSINASNDDAQDKASAGKQAGGQNLSRVSEETKTQDLAKARRDDIDPNLGQE